MQRHQICACFSFILCLLSCRALYKIYHQTKDELKVFCLLYFKIFFFYFLQN
nr:MAG TPA: hypothetical protein [Bacteriophage sp.]